MLSTLVSLAVLSPLLAAVPHGHQHGHLPCGRNTTRTVTEYVTVTADDTTASAASTVAPGTSTDSSSTLHMTSTETVVVTVVPTAAESSTTTSPEVVEQPTTTTTKEVVQPTTTSKEVAQPTTTSKVVVQPTTTTTKAASTTLSIVKKPTGGASSSTTIPASTNNAAVAPLAAATPVSYRVGATMQCGNSDRLIMPGLPWTVANSMYDAAQMVGSQCTNFRQVLKSSTGTNLVKWTSVTDVEFVDDTKDDCKGYSNVGIGVNLGHQLSEISSIPAYYSWNRTVSSDFRGTNLYDFVTAPTKGDGTSTATNEFMLWLKIWGGQVPIGYAQGPVATLDLYGTSWRLYSGKNPGSGVTVRSMLPDNEFEGEFSGDLKEWLDAMVAHGYIADSQFVNVGNVGTEIFYGKTTQDVVTALDIEI